MKLNNKILLGNLVLSVVIFFITSIGMYFLVNDTVNDELDNHLLHHKSDILNQLQGNPVSLDQIREVGGLGSYEWVDIEPFKEGIPVNTNRFTTIDTVRNPEKEQAETYRRLATTISLNGQTYTMTIYEEVASWQNISMTILLSVLAGLLIWILLLYLVNQIAFNKLLTPFYNTVDTLESISNPTDFEERFPDSTTYEIEVLNRALNSMMDQIKSSFEEQKRFIQNASHELLTPLSIIRQKSEKILSRSDSLNPETVEAASDIQQTAVRLSRLSNSLLLISRVENRQYKLNDKVSLKKVTEEVLRELDDFISMKNISIERAYEDDITVQGNKELIHSAIYNILQNAVKFSGEDSAIHIALWEKEDSPKLIVSDEGPGIPENIKGSLFDRFRKGDGPSNALGKNNGIGLGLSLVKSICNLHNFSCEVENRQEGGTKITIHF